MWLKGLLSILLLAVLAWVVSQHINPSELLTVIKNFPKIHLVILITLSFIISTLKAWRFLIILRNASIDLSFWQNLKSYITSQALSPLPGGEMLRGFLVKEETGVPVSKITGSVITQAYLELIAAAILALLGSLVFHVLLMPIAAVLIILVGIGYFLIKEHLILKLFKRLPKRRFIKRIEGKIKLAQKGIRIHLYDEESGLPDKVFIRSLGISLLINTLGALLILVIADAFGLRFSFLHALFIYSASVLIGGIALSPGGVGLTEGGLMGILLLFKIDFTKAVAMVLIFRLTTLLFSILAGMIFFLIFYSRSMLFSKLAIGGKLTSWINILKK